LIISAAMRALLEQQPDLEVVSEANRHDVIACTRRSEPDIVVVVAPAMTVENPRELADLAALSKVVLIELAVNVHRLHEALRVGVRAALAPSSPAEELLHVLRTIARGDTVVMSVDGSPPANTALPHRVTELGVRLRESITTREAEVLTLLTQGASNAEIAVKLFVSTATVRSHVHHILHKLDVRTRAQAVAIAYQTGLVHELTRN
jgi:DNA-binding NarL/FixJ family response regulator